MWITSLRLTFLSLLVCSLIYPAVVVGVAQLFAPQKRLGSLIYGENQAVIGSQLIGQAFSEDRYFWPRPSAVNFDASAAGGSNLSPGNSLITQRATEIIAKVSASGPLLVPADLVTASGSGLDPHISLDAALIQLERVAIANKTSKEEILQLVKSQARLVSPFSKEEIINVLELNLAIKRFDN